MSRTIEIVPYNPEWPALFEVEKSALQAALSPWLVGDIEHIGSTAVAGLSDKPVIDIMAPVRSLLESSAAIPAVMAEGYVHRTYRSDVMHWFCKPSPLVRTHHLHLVPMGSALWAERLAFRDALRADPKLAKEYSELKERLAQLHDTDWEAYTLAKGPFISNVLSRACGSYMAPVSLTRSALKPSIRPLRLAAAPSVKRLRQGQSLQ